MIMMATGLAMAPRPRPSAHPPLRLLISGNLVAPLKMGIWGIHHLSNGEGDSQSTAVIVLAKMQLLQP